MSGLTPILDDADDGCPAMRQPGGALFADLQALWEEYEREHPFRTEIAKAVADGLAFVIIAASETDTAHDFHTRVMTLTLEHMARENETLRMALEQRVTS